MYVHHTTEGMWVSAEHNTPHIKKIKGANLAER